MIVYTTEKELQKHLLPLRKEGRILGMVPTMGALHEGHLSLVRRCISETDLCVVSIFVNPTQFNEASDLSAYPRTPEEDLALLESEGVDVVFMPLASEIYPEPDTRVFEFDGLDRVMEGEQRPGHFNGVAQVVSILFRMAIPHRAYFGQKDFQQLAIIRQMVGILKLDIEIIACPVIREDDGLAMSSRNRRLTPEERKAAPLIYKCLQEALNMQAEFSPEEITKRIEIRFGEQDMLQLEYFQIVQSRTLQEVSHWKEGLQYTGCIAVRLGTVRLIDNVNFA